MILLAHGSQRGTSRDECSCSWQSDGPNPPSWCLGCTGTNQGLQTAVGLLQNALASQGATVMLSCLEFIEPHPSQALQILHQQGLEKVVLLPFLLGNGKHATLELDEILADARTETPGLRSRPGARVGLRTGDGRIGLRAVAVNASPRNTTVFSGRPHRSDVGQGRHQVPVRRLRVVGPPGSTWWKRSWDMGTLWPRPSLIMATPPWTTPPLNWWRTGGFPA